MDSFHNNIVCLNPCCNGMKIECVDWTTDVCRGGLNPCCNGMKIELLSGG